MFIKNTILISMVLGTTSLSFVGCGDTTATDDPNDFSMCDTIGYTNNATNNIDALSGDNPIITLDGQRIITISQGTTTILPNGDIFYANDAQDGDLTNQVERTDDINSNVQGEYHIKYRVEDSDGNEDIKCRKVIVTGTNTSTNGIYDNGNYDDSNYDDSNYNTDNYDNGGSYNNDNGYVDDYTGQGNSNLGTPIDNGNYANNINSDLDTFIAWYSNTCGGVFNNSLYNEATKSYNGTIDCSNRGLTSIDLTPLSMFDGINEIKLNNNRLTDIDFTPIRDIHTLWKLDISYNTQTLKNKYDTVSERNALFRFFTNLHGGDGKTTGLWIGFKPRNGDENELRIDF